MSQSIRFTKEETLDKFFRDFERITNDCQKKYINSITNIIRIAKHLGVTEAELSEEIVKRLLK